MNLAAVPCIRGGCPSDAADWEGIFAGGYIVADSYTCRLCGAAWIEWHNKIP